MALSCVVSRFSLSGGFLALECLFPKELPQVGRNLDRCYRCSLVQVLVCGQLLEHEVRQICPGGCHPR